jgi:hypothetical protein
MRVSLNRICGCNIDSIWLTAVVLHAYEFLSLTLNEEQSAEEQNLREREK